MPVVSKVDSKCVNVTRKLDALLSLANTGGKPPPAPQDFWKELAQSPDNVSR